MKLVVFYIFASFVFCAPSFFFFFPSRCMYQKMMNISIFKEIFAFALTNANRIVAGNCIEKWKENIQFKSPLYADIILEMCLLSCVRNMVETRKTKIFYTTIIIYLQYICSADYLIYNSALLISLVLAKRVSWFTFQFQSMANYITISAIQQFCYSNPSQKFRFQERGGMNWQKKIKNEKVVCTGIYLLVGRGLNVKGLLLGGEQGT